MNTGAGKKVMGFEPFLGCRNRRRPELFGLLREKGKELIGWQLLQPPGAERKAGWTRFKSSAATDFELVYTSCADPARHFRMARAQAYGAGAGAPDTEAAGVNGGHWQGARRTDRV